MNSKLRPDVVREQRVWADPGSITFFDTHRHRVGDLYPSERWFLPNLLPEIRSVLDVGCAAGGFSEIMRAFNDAIDYTGVDVNPEFVALAQSKYPDSKFEVGDGIHFQTPAGSYDLVHSSGILHLNSHYKEIVSACYGQARRFLLCDFRLTPGQAVEGTFNLEFGSGDNASLVLPYIVPNLNETLEFLASLAPHPRVVRAHAYYHPPSPMATIPLERVLMTVVLLEKEGGDAQIKFDLDLPEPLGH